MKRITKIDAAAKETKKLRVAAYARVSTDSADQLVSLEAQKEHYKQDPEYHKQLQYDQTAHTFSSFVSRSSSSAILSRVFP